MLRDHIQRVRHKEPLPERRTRQHVLEHILLIKIDMPLPAERIGQPELIREIDHRVLLRDMRVIRLTLPPGCSLLIEHYINVRRQGLIVITSRDDVRRRTAVRDRHHRPAVDLDRQIDQIMRSSLSHAA
ncbi:MAG: hypothetical protein CMJ35_00090 [Phycisphaerae bacterium]|nr:hypothetical protein [Phycisphaerae bacterium]MBM89998.1 hypothetical protein [Phycisphaerae bacterium]HCT44651.1 hypothetical protein [Phycisphaerales bacterium]